MTVKAKRCARCETTKPAVCFKPDKRMKHGLSSWCQDCWKAYEQERNLRRHPDRRRGVVGRKPKQVIDGQLVCGTCDVSKPTAEFVKDSTAPTGFRSRCKTCDSAAAKVAYSKNRETRIAKARAWNRANPERYYANKTRNVQENVQERLRARLRCRIATIFWKMKQTKTRPASAVRDLGCTIPELMAHLERQFQPGMTWDNYGEWHIDHVKPLASFDLTDRLQFLAACHFTNLQPLWGPDNIAKGARSL